MLTSLLRFHLYAGARLALRAAAPAVGLPVFGLLLQQDPAGAAAGMARWLAAPAGSLSNGLALAGVAMALAAWAAPRVTGGMTGWLRHLPVTEVDRRRAALAALVVVQTPLLVAWLPAAGFAMQQGLAPAPERLAALLLAMCAAAVAAWPAEHRLRSAPLAVGAVLLSATARPSAILAGMLLVAAAERVAGPLAVHGGSRHSALTFRRLSALGSRLSPAFGRRRLRGRRRSVLSGVPIPLRTGLRGLGPAALIMPLASLLPLAAAAAFQVNNEGLPPEAAAGATRLGGGLAVAFLLSALTNRLVVRRPAWPWARSLPAGASQRIDQDAIPLAIPCLVALAVTAWMNAASALAVAACVPALALRAAGALRRSTETRMGPAGPVLVEGALVAGLVTVVPWLALAMLAAAPLARRAAADEDRRQKVSRWEERRHAPAGDSLSWSAR